MATSSREYAKEHLKNINCIEQRFGEGIGEKNFALVQFSWNFVHVYVNANVVIPENMVVLH